MYVIPSYAIITRARSQEKSSKAKSNLTLSLQKLNQTKRSDQPRGENKR